MQQVQGKPNQSFESMETQSRAYQSVARAIGYLQTHRRQQPTLDELAQAVGWTPAHLQRVFSDWAGISPKRFLQILAMRDAAGVLPEHNVLEASHAAGLSGPGRLHDLVVNCEAVTPGELKSGGAGLNIEHGEGPTPFGPALVAWTTRGVCHLQFVPQESSSAPLLAALQTQWPKARFEAKPKAAQAQLARIFTRTESKNAPLHVLVRGTNFQVQVWRALLAIPEGTTTTYGELATQLGKPKGARAVASAVASHSIGVLIPCHRVIRASGALGGYRWGLERKLALLGWEAARASEAKTD